MTKRKTGILEWAFVALAAAAFPAALALAGWDPNKPPAGGALVSADIRSNWTALAQALGGTNLLADRTFLVWAAGDAAAPTSYSLSGAGATIARAGTGLVDTARKVGKYCAKVTAGGAATGTLEQQLLSTTSFDDHVVGLAFSAGAWVKCSNASAGRLTITDGALSDFSSYHSGGGAWEWLTVSHVVDVSATKVSWQFTVAATRTCYVSGPTVVLGPVSPQYSQPSAVGLETIERQVQGNVAVAIPKFNLTPHRPGIVQDVQLEVITAPATTAIIVDLKTYDGAALTSMYTTKPQIAAGAKRGGAQPDTTYARRCFAGYFGAGALAAGQQMSIEITQVGTGTTGADLNIRIFYKFFDRPLEEFLAYNDLT